MKEINSLIYGPKAALEAQWAAFQQQQAMQIAEFKAKQKAKADLEFWRAMFWVSILINLGTIIWACSK